MAPADGAYTIHYSRFGETYQRTASTMAEAMLWAYAGTMAARFRLDRIVAPDGWEYDLEDVFDYGAERNWP